MTTNIGGTQCSSLVKMKMLHCLAICVFLPLVVADTLKFHPRARGKSSSKMTDGELALLVEQFLGGQKATNLKDFVFKTCGGNTGSTLKLDITPHTLHFPGTITINAKIDLKQAIDNPTVALDMKKNFNGNWIDLPCIANIGSCTYNNLCDQLKPVTCPPKLNCKCPFKPELYTVSELTIPVNAAVFITGDFQVHANVTFGANGKYYQCIYVEFSVE